MKLLLTLSLVLSLSACQTPQVSAVPTATRSVSTPVANPDDLMNQDLFEGFYGFGFETSAFTPCGVKEQWWVTPADNEVGQELVSAYQATTGTENRAVYARLAAKFQSAASTGISAFTTAHSQSVKL